MQSGKISVAHQLCHSRLGNSLEARGHLAQVQNMHFAVISETPIKKGLIRLSKVVAKRYGGPVVGRPVGKTPPRVGRPSACGSCSLPPSDQCQHTSASSALPHSMTGCTQLPSVQFACSAALLLQAESWVWKPDGEQCDV